MPTEMRNALNESAIREFIGSPANYSLDELQGELDQVNLGYSQAFLALA